jgi:hypothetical protein
VLIGEQPGMLASTSAKPPFAGERQKNNRIAFPVVFSVI